MKFLKCSLLIILGCSVFLYSINRDELPNPQLDYARVEWWFPQYVTPKLHITLSYFEIGNIWENFAQKPPQEKRQIRKEYAQTKDELIQAKNTLLSTEKFNDVFKGELANDETFNLRGIDIISTHPDFYNHFVLNTSAHAPSGTKNNIERFKRIFEHGDPFGTSVAQTKHGKKVFPKYRWYIVAKFENNIVNFRNKLCTNPLLHKFPENDLSGYLPHMTLGKIHRIQDVNKLISAIQKANIRLSKEPKASKSFKLKDIERRHPDEHKVYLLLDKAHKSNMIFMLVVGWQTILGKLIEDIVKQFPEHIMRTEKASYVHPIKPNFFDSIFQVNPTNQILHQRV